MFGTLRRLDRAHPPVVGRVHVAHLDRRALAGEAARAQRRQAAAVRETGQAVGLIHELGQLRRAEELLQGGGHRADVDDRLRRDRVLVLGGEALADDPLHPVEADPEGLLDQLADGAQPAVAEVLVLVEVVLDRVARDRRRVGGVVLALLGHAQLDRQVDQPLHQLDDVAGGENAALGRYLGAEPHVQLVAADPGEVVALGVEEQRAHQVARVVDRGRLARALLLEHLDQRRLLATGTGPSRASSG